jgi:hypothetical protein
MLPRLSWETFFTSLNVMIPSALSVPTGKLP